MRLTVNGEACGLDGSDSLLELFAKLGVRPERVAVLINDEVVPKEKRASVRLRDGDRVELLTFAGGG